MGVFALTYTYGGSAELLAEHRPAHREFLRGLHERGTNLASGPLGESEALIILEAESPEEIEQLVEQDPLVVHGVVTEHTVRPWSVTIGGVGSA